jgi:hypothetical protein
MRRGMAMGEEITNSNKVKRAPSNFYTDADNPKRIFMTWYADPADLTASAAELDRRKVLDNAMKEGLEGLPGDDLLVPSNADVEGVLRGDVDVLFEYKPQDDMTREELCRATEFYKAMTRLRDREIVAFKRAWVNAEEVTEDEG